MFVQCPSGGPEGDRTLEPHGCEPCALPAELQAQIGTFYAEKVAEFGFLKYALFRKNQQIEQENREQEIRSDVSRYGCERSALPAELRAQIGTIRAKKVANFGFLKYSIFRGKSNKSDRKTGNRKSDRICLNYGCEPNALPTELQAQTYFIDRVVTRKALEAEVPRLFSVLVEISGIEPLTS